MKRLALVLSTLFIIFASLSSVALCEGMSEYLNRSPDTTQPIVCPVYIAIKNGEVYHPDKSCRYLKKANEILEVDEIEALEREYRICKVCDKSRSKRMDVLQALESALHQEDSVLVANIGITLYHTDENCSYLKHAQSVVVLDVRVAMERGLVLCGICE